MHSRTVWIFVLINGRDSLARLDHIDLTVPPQPSNDQVQDLMILDQIHELTSTTSKTTPPDNKQYCVISKFEISHDS